MGQVLAFPCWGVLTRDEGKSPGDPRALIAPSGRLMQVEQVLHRRLYASRDPQAPLRYESLVQAGGKIFQLIYDDAQQAWQVLPR